MNAEILNKVEQMSQEDAEALLNTQFPAELEKEAEAEIDGASLADALYQYGCLTAERAVAEEEGLDKFAAEDVEAHEASEKEIGEAIESLLTATGTVEIEDEAELHKEAQAAASLVFEGYTDTLEKLAKDKASFVKGVSKKLHEGMKKAKDAAKATHKAGKKGGYHALGGLAVGAGAMKAKEMLSKKASELTFGEIYDMMFDKMAGDNEVADGIDKIAARASKKAVSFVSKMKDKAVEGAKAAKKHVKGSKGLYGLGAGAVGGFAAGRASKE
jgi:L-fucose mutarotase/ribose pyranase (RbsD/FucU family)